MNATHKLIIIDFYQIRFSFKIDIKYMGQCSDWSVGFSDHIIDIINCKSMEKKKQNLKQHSNFPGQCAYLECFMD